MLGDESNQHNRLHLPEHTISIWMIHLLCRPHTIGRRNQADTYNLPSVQPVENF